MKNTITAILLCLLAVGCTKSSYYQAEDGRIVKDGVPQYFIGTNVWYASTLATTEPDRLLKELDTLAALGVRNLRVLATDENWEGLDFTLKELQKRDMCAVLYLNNAWEWTEDCYSKYLEDAGEGKQPVPSVDGYVPYMNAMSKFAQSPKAVELYQEHVKRVVSRYKDNPAIFSWQLCNEPRPFSREPEAVDAFVNYIHSTAALIKSIDHNHMVSTGNEGAMGCNDGDNDLYMRVHDCPDIDYCTIHIWPYNWSWVREHNIDEGIDTAIERTREYIRQSLEVAYRLRKPAVIEEFGYPRDGFAYVNDTPTTARDKYYDYIFGEVLSSAKNGGRLAGCNFWTWSGYARQTPGHQFWQEGDDLCGDPSQEAQGLNGVYLSDTSTIEVISKYTKKIAGCATVFPIIEHDWIYDGDVTLNFSVSSQSPCEVNISLAVVPDTTLMYTQDTIATANSRIVIKKAGKAVSPVTFGGLAPGFYQIRYTVEKTKGGKGCGGELPVQSFNIGVQPEAISSPQDKPADFDEFWDRTLAELAAVPIEPVLTLLPEHSNADRNVYRVEMRSLGGALMGGYLAEPVKPGKYRTFIDYMGYGSEPYIYAPSGAPDCVEFLVSVRDQGIFKPGNQRWIDRGLNSREDFYYRGAYCDVVRAIDFLCGRENVDQEHLFARGESQGGAFAWISASLDHRVKAIATSVPFLSDYEDYSKIVWWPVWEVFESADNEGIGRSELFEMLKYFDVKNFTDKVECPVLMAFGMQDPTCPPHTNFAGYNQVKSQKEYLCVPTCGHGMWQENACYARRDEFFSRY